MNVNIHPYRNHNEFLLVKNLKLTKKIQTRRKKTQEK